jgi:hypothetical protein
MGLGLIIGFIEGVQLVTTPESELLYDGAVYRQAVLLGTKPLEDHNQ